MFRKAAGAAACVIFMGSVAFGVAAWAQEYRQAAPRPLTFGERLDRFRRNLIGDDEEPAPEIHSHNHNHNHAHRHARASSSPSPRVASSTQRGASGASQQTTSPPPRMTRQSAVKAQPSGKAPANIIRRQTVPRAASRSAPSRHAETAASNRRDSLREEETIDEEEEVVPDEEAPEFESRRTVGEPSRSASSVFDDEELEEPEPAPEESSSLRAPASSGHSRPRQSRSTTSAANKQDLLFSGHSPVLSVETLGPRRITVGRPAEYRINLKNEGDFAATDVVVRVNLPGAVEVHEARATAGAAGMLESEPGVLQWSVNSLAVGAREQLSLELVTRENRPFDLGVRWASAAMGSNATVEVQEAKLELTISGADEVLCGAKEVYRLSVSNPGNGPAENVVVRLLPLVPGEGEPTSHDIGLIPAGDSKVVEIELVARQGGKLLIQAEALAEGDLRSAASEEVTVRQPALDVAASGPARQYAGAEATYDIRLQNPGDADARRVKVSAALPSGAGFVACSRGGKFDAKRNRVSWSLDDLAPGAEDSLQLKYVLQTPGENQLEVVATADGDLRESNVAITDVIAVADLVLDVSDPSGPVAVGHDAVYELRVRNRGSKAAEGIEIVAFYSKGIEPVSAEGAAHEISPGTVVFDPIASLGAGEEMTLKIHARAEAGGMHRFRVELQSKALGTKLTQEESTLFYGDEAPVMQARKTRQSDSAGAKATRIAKPPRTSELR